MYIKVKGKDVNIYGAQNIDEATKSQLYEAVSQHYVTRAALMPDAHKGYALPIGGVVACDGMVVPAYVGYDIGCGMCAFQLKGVGMDEVRRNADKIFSMIYRRIPVGTDHHKDNQKWGTYGDADYWENIPMSDWFYKNFLEKNGLSQLGTLGGGNHFIEIGVDTNKKVWIILHSGSRGIGHNTGTYYMRKAGGGKVREGNYPLDVTSELGKEYIMDMNFCLEFALKNRLMMGDQVLNILKQVLEKEIDVVELINRNHNHAEEKNGEWIHRKGATHAEAGMMGVIPGNMRDGSFIVRGLGNEDALCSSSHGAGRLYSRTKAKEMLSTDTFRKEMSGITAKVGKSTLDESAGAYKDIHMVMENQESLVEVITHVKPIINIKA